MFKALSPCLQIHIAESITTAAQIPQRAFVRFNQEFDPRPEKGDRPFPLSFWLSLLSLTTSIAVLGGVPAVFALQTQQSAAPEIGSGGITPGLLLSQALSSLAVGDVGDAVIELQTRLADLGYYQGAIDGDFGAGTEAAVIEFQQDNGLVPDGVVGAATQSALQNQAQPATGDSEASGALRLGDSGDAVAALQTRLSQLNYYQGGIDGDFGSETETAVIRFQEDNQLVADGIVGAATQAALDTPGTSGAPSAAPLSPPTTPPAGSLSTNGGILQRGDQGDNVRNLQTQLRDLNFYEGRITGVFDARTEDAVSAFQRSQGLPADGIVGSQTTTALQTASSNRTRTGQATPRIERFSVSDLQRRLQARGFYQGEIDGDAGPATRAAIAAAQRAYGLTENDIIGGRF